MDVRSVKEIKRLEIISNCYGKRNRPIYSKRFLNNRNTFLSYS